MNLRRLRIAASIAMLSTGAGVAWASCGGTEGLVSGAAAGVASKLVAQLVKSTTQIVLLDREQTDSILSAIKVMTKQVELSGEKSAANALQTQESIAAFSKELADKELVDKMMLDYLSQGYSPCEQSSATIKVAISEQNSKSAVPVRIHSEVEAVGGKYMSRADSLVSRDRLHKKMFCTQDEVDSGACSSLGELPGGDSNASLLYSTDNSRTAVEAKNALINNVIGLPDNPVPPSVAGSAEAANYILSKKKKDAFLSWAAYSLKSIQSESEVFKKPMNERVGMFFGTPTATSWAVSQASQSPRGILVDLVKIKGLALKLQERKLIQNLRMEANLAAMLELDNQKFNGLNTKNLSDRLQVDISNKGVVQ